MHRLGGHVLGFADAKMTRAGDFYQESIKDTVHMLEYYGDVIAMRHFQQGAPAEAAHVGVGAGDQLRRRLGRAPDAGAHRPLHDPEGAGHARRAHVPARRRHAHADDALDPLRAVAVRREGVRRRAARDVAAARVQARARRAQRPLRGGRVGRGRDRRLRRHLHGAGRPGRLRRSRATSAARRASRHDAADVPGDARAAARRRRSRARSSCTACRGWTSCPSDVDATRHARYWRRRSTASSCGWRCSPSCSERWSRPMEFTLNGEPVSREPREDESLLELLRERLRAALGEGRLRARGLVRRLHRDRRRPRRRLVRAEGDARRGQARRHAGGPAGRRRGGAGRSASSRPARRSAASARRGS